MELFVTLLTAGGLMAIIDFVWLGFIAKKLYYGELGDILLKKPRLIPAILFYVIYVIGIVVFGINPALEENSWTTAAVMGGLFGFIAYATYDLTNLATMKGFSTKIVVIDLIWGTVLTAAVATGTYLVVSALF